MTLDPLVVFGTLGSLLGTLATTGVKGVWVWGWTYKAMVDDRNFWRSAALELMGMTGKAIDVAVTTTSKDHGA